MDDFEYSEIECPACGHSPTHTRYCDNIDCDDGFVDLYDEDPINESPGTLERCSECHGTGHHHWCPKCGHDLNSKQNISREPRGGAA